METTNNTKSLRIWQCTWECALFFHIVTTISYAFSPAVNKNCKPHAWKPAPVEVTHCHHCWNTAPTASLCSQPLFGLHQNSATVNECQQTQFFLHWGIQWHTFASSTLPCQTSFYQTAPLLPFFTWHQNIMTSKILGRRSTSTAIPSTSASDIVGQRSKTGGTALRTALTFVTIFYGKQTEKNSHLFKNKKE